MDDRYFTSPEHRHLARAFPQLDVRIHNGEFVQRACGGPRVCVLKPCDFRTQAHTLASPLAAGKPRGPEVRDFVALHPLSPISLPSRTCRAIRFNSKSFNQCVQAALNQNVRPSRRWCPVRQTFPPPPPSPSYTTGTPLRVSRPSLVSSYSPRPLPLRCTSPHFAQ